MQENEFTENIDETEYESSTSANQNVNTKTRPDICINEKYIENMRPIPGNRSYASTTKYGQKIFVVGDSHIKIIRRNLFNNSIVGGKSYIKSFDGSNTKRLHHYITPTLVDEKPDIVVIHVGFNDINNNNYASVNINTIAENIVEIGIKKASITE